VSFFVVPFLYLRFGKAWKRAETVAELA